MNTSKSPLLTLCGPAAGNGFPSHDVPPSPQTTPSASQAEAQRASGAAAATSAMTWPEIEQMVRDLRALGLDLPECEYFVRAARLPLGAA